MTLNRCQTFLQVIWIHGEGPTHHTPRCLMVLVQRTSSTHIFTVMSRWIITDSPGGRHWGRGFITTPEKSVVNTHHTPEQRIVLVRSRCLVGHMQGESWLEQNERTVREKRKQNRTEMVRGQRKKVLFFSIYTQHIQYTVTWFRNPSNVLTLLLNKHCKKRNCTNPKLI